MGKSIAILQSNYIPWKGYFDIIRSVDIFVIYDDVQFTCQDWRNRNKIKTPEGLKWLTIPVHQKGRINKKISEISVAYETNWTKKHWASIYQNYGKAPFFKTYSSIFEGFYATLPERNLLLSGINTQLIALINDILKIPTEIVNSADFNIQGERSERLVSFCQQFDCDHYLSGPAAKNYLDTSLFEAAGIQVEWMDYDSYPEYQQLYGSFEHSVTILDLIFNTGPQALSYLSRKRL